MSIENQSISEVQKKDEAKKWWLEILQKLFTKNSNKKTAVDQLKVEIEELTRKWIKTKERPYSIIIEEINLFMKDIFGDDGKYKATAYDGINKLAQALKIDGKDTLESIDGKRKEASDFMNKYSITEFKFLIYNQVINHPLSSTFGFSKFKELKKQVEYLWTNLPPEYVIVINTIENIMKSSDFSKNTGKIDEALQRELWNEKKVEEFKKNMQSFLNMSVTQKRVLNMGDFDKYFNENAELTPKEKEENNRFAQEVNSMINALGTKWEKLTLIDEIISRESVVWKYSKKQQSDRLSYLHNIRSEKERWQNNDIKWILWQSLRDFESSNKREDVEKEAERLRQTTRSPHFVDYDTKLKKYVIISAADLARELLKPNLWNIDRTLFQTLLKASNWEMFIKEAIWSEGIAAVWLYIKNRPDTQLFNGIEWAKWFFIENYQKTVTHQNSILKEKNIQNISGEIIDSFPWTFNLIPPNLRNNLQLQNALRQANTDQFYGLLRKEGVSTETIKTIMKEVFQEAHKLRIKNPKEALKESINWKWKKFSDARSEFTFKDGDKSTEETLFKWIQEKSISIGSISTEKAEEIMRALPESSSLYIYLKKVWITKNAGRLEWWAKRIDQILRNTSNNKPAPTLTKEEVQSVKGFENLWWNLAENNLNSQLAKQNIRSGDLKEEKERKIQLEKERKQIAITVASLKKDSWVSQDNLRELIRDTSDSILSNEQIDKWIDTQVFISKYVEEKNFVDIVEKNAAYMNLWETKSIGDLYWMNKVDISNMSSESGSIRLSETNIWWFDNFTWMNELMNCRVEVGDNWVFTRTIKSPEGIVIAENVPLENIDSTIQQLWRFYVLGLWVLAPYMKQISTSIGKSRPDKVSGLDGNFDIKEDEKFLKILAIMLYGRDSLPTDSNIPNLIRLFNKPWQENNPKYILKQKWIINDSGAINTIRLDTELQNSSKEVF